MRTTGPVGGGRHGGGGRQNHRWSGGDASESEADELSDGEISKLVIVTQTPSRPKKHDGFDRTGDYTTRTKLSQVRTEITQELLWKCTVHCISCINSSIYRILPR